MLFVIVLMVFITATLAFFALFQSFDQEGRVVRDRLRRFVEESKQAAGELSAAADEQQRGKKAPSPLRVLLKTASRTLDSKEAAKKLQIELERADILLKGSEFLVINALVAVGLGVLGLIVTKGNPLAALGGLILGYLLPRAYLSRRQKDRQKRFVGQIADSLTLISNSLKAGYSFLQAMELVAQEMPPPISVEYRRVLKEVSLGVPTETSLEALARRVGSDDMDLVVTCVLIQRQVGGNLADVLDTIAFTIRQRIRIKGEIKTLTAQGRFSGLIVSLLPFALAGLVSVINPTYMKLLFTHPLGRPMLMVAFVSELVGIFVIRQITDIEV